MGSYQQRTHQLSRHNSASILCNWVEVLLQLLPNLFLQRKTMIMAKPHFATDTESPEFIRGIILSSEFCSNELMNERT